MSADNAIVFDAYAWVEYALGTPKAEKVAELLESAPEAVTPASVLAELKESMLRHGIRAQVMNRILTYIKSRTTVVGIDSEIAELAGGANFSQKKTTKDWGMFDSFVYAIAKLWDGTVLTGDPHFKHLKNVIYIGEVREPKEPQDQLADEDRK